MAFTPDKPFPKQAGDVIRSKDWTDAIEEVQRLDTAKVNKVGDDITGPLNIAGRVLAENFASGMELEPGDVVCMGPDEGTVVISGQRDDGLVMGVVSSEPGLLLNSALVDVVGGVPVFPIALCGRVPCKVVAENGPIERGDLLASSSTSGHAMKATSVLQVQDPDDPSKQVELHRAGTILGKAVGSLSELPGTGVIEVFVTAR